MTYIKFFSVNNAILNVLSLKFNSIANFNI